MLTGKRPAVHELSPSHEHYLRAIYQARSQRGYARLTDVARALGVAPSTLSVGLRALESRALVAHDDRRFLVLTAQGERLAREVHHRFAVISSFLRDVLGVPEPEALGEACLLEHQLSPPTAERLLDLVKLLNEDADFRELFRRRLSEYRRSCRPAAECATCDLTCLASDATVAP